MKLLRLSIKEIRKKKFFSILILLVCVIAMQTVLSAYHKCDQRSLSAKNI